MGIVDAASGGIAGAVGGGTAAKVAGMASNTLGPQVEGLLQSTGISGLLASLGLGGLGRTDPDAGYRFFIEIDGIGVVRFKDASGLKMTTKVSKVREGGNNIYEHAFIDSQTFEPLLIKKGFYAGSDEFFNWMKELHDPGKKIERKTISVVLLNDKGSEVCRFNLYGAFIMEYEAPSFDAQGKDIIFESVKLNYDYYEFEKADLLDSLIDNALAAGMSMLANAL